MDVSHGFNFKKCMLIVTHEIQTKLHTHIKMSFNFMTEYFKSNAVILYKVIGVLVSLKCLNL